MPTTETIEVPAEAPVETPLPPREAAVAFLRDRLQAGDTDTLPQPAEATETAPEAVEGEPAPEGQEAAESEPQEPAESEGEGEESKPEPAEEDSKKDKFATRFAALAREEKRIRKERDALKAQEAELARFKGAIEKLKTDPLAALQELGVDYDELTRRVLSGGKPDASDEVKALREKLEALERERQAEAERAQQAQIEAAFAAAKRDLATLSRDSARFPLASKWDAAEVAEGAFAIIESHFTKTGQVLSFDAALQEVEKRLEDYRKRLVGDAPSQSAPSPQAPPKAPPRAITNGVVTAQGTALAELSEEERREQAIRALKNRRR